MASIVYLIGAGPGDPDLITVKGADCLRRADVLIYDYLAHPALTEWTPAHCEKIYVGKKAGQHTLSQEGINALLVEKALEKADADTRLPRVIVRLKGGDPYVFGRGGEEVITLREAGIPFEVVPGVTAGVAAPAYAGIPVTHRAIATNVTFITGHERAEAEADSLPYSTLAKLDGTLVFYMGVGNVGKIMRRLIEEGLASDTPAGVIRWGTYPRQQTVTATAATLEQTVLEAGIKPPAIIIVGQVVALRDQLTWFEQRPLFGRRILVTRSRTQSSDLLACLANLGAEAIEFPTIEINPTDDPRSLRDAVTRSGDYDWVVFSSTNAVEHFFKAVDAIDRDVRVLGAAKLAAIGPATGKALEARGLKVDLVPERYVAEDLVEGLKQYGDLSGKRFLIPRSNIGRDLMPKALEEAGAQVDQVNAYRTDPARPANYDAIVADLDAGHIDAVTFTSSSTARNFADIVGQERFAQLSGKCCLASIGDITSQTMEKLGGAPTIQADRFTIDGLVDKLIQHFKK